MSFKCYAFCLFWMCHDQLVVLQSDTKAGLWIWQWWKSWIIDFLEGMLRWFKRFPMSTKKAEESRQTGKQWTRQEGDSGEQMHLSGELNDPAKTGEMNWAAWSARAWLVDWLQVCELIGSRRQTERHAHADKHRQRENHQGTRGRARKKNKKGKGSLTRKLRGIGNFERCWVQLAVPKINLINNLFPWQMLMFK